MNSERSGIRASVREIGVGREADTLTRIGVFVDAQNFQEGLRELGVRGEVQYKRLLRFVRNGVGNRRITEARYYSAETSDLTASSSVVTRYFRAFGIAGKLQDGIWKKPALDIALASDMIDNKDKFDEAVLLAGDGDYEHPVRLLLKAGKRVRVISTRRSLAPELLQPGVEIVFLDDILSDITKEDKNASKSPNLKVV